MFIVSFWSGWHFIQRGNSAPSSSSGSPTSSENSSESSSASGFGSRVASGSGSSSTSGSGSSSGTLSQNRQPSFLLDPSQFINGDRYCDISLSLSLDTISFNHPCVCRNGLSNPRCLTVVCKRGSVEFTDTVRQTKCCCFQLLFCFILTITIVRKKSVFYRRWSSNR